MNDLKKICEDCVKLKESIQKNKIVFSATKEQEDAFYRMIDAFINRLETHINSNAEMEHVIKTVNSMDVLERFNESSMTYRFDKMREILVEQYMIYGKNTDKRKNFVSEVEPRLFYPIRVVAEKLHREFFKEEFDRSLNSFFDAKKI